jgi:hypothetical protein
VVITDIREHWAAVWILSVARAGVMEPFANYAFQPDSGVRRAELADVVSRLLAKLAELRPALQSRWLAPPATFPDLTEGHLAYPAASLAVGAGVLATGPDGSFRPLEPVSGQEARAAMSRLEELASPAVGKSSPR